MAGPSVNKLLQTLQQLAPVGTFNGAERVELLPGHVLQCRGQRVSQVYFPLEAVLSMRGVMRNGESIEVAMVGLEGMVGVEACLSQLPATHDVLVQIPGSALRLPRQALLDACSRTPGIYAVALQCSLALLMQATQMAACNRLHSVEQQLCRWLLMAFERMRCEEVPITQVRLATALGVRREGVTQVARRLQDAGLIDYSRGAIRLTNRDGLAVRACECFHELQAAYALQRQTPSCPHPMQL